MHLLKIKNSTGKAALCKGGSQTLAFDWGIIKLCYSVVGAYITPVSLHTQPENINH